jgi:hypothetical protein
MQHNMSLVFKCRINNTSLVLPPKFKLEEKENRLRPTTKPVCLFHQPTASIRILIAAKFTSSVNTANRFLRPDC